MAMLVDPPGNYTNGRKPPGTFLHSPRYEKSKEDETAVDMSRTGKRKSVSGLEAKQDSFKEPFADVRVKSQIQRRVRVFLNDPISAVLNLSYLPLDEKYADDITDALITMGKTRVLTLRDCLRPGSLLPELCSKFGKYDHGVEKVTIDRVDVSANRNLGIDDTKSLGMLLRMWNTECLDLSECCLQTKEMKCLQEEIQTDCKVKTLVYNSNKISFGIIRSLSALASSTHMKELRIANCNLTKQLLSTMEDSMKEAKVKILDLSYNRRNPKEAYEIIGRIVAKSKIDTVLFVDCKMKYGHLLEFQHGLGEEQVEKLNLSYNVGILESSQIFLAAETLKLIGPTSLGLAGCVLSGYMLSEVANVIKLKSLTVVDNPKLSKSPDILIDVIDSSGGMNLEISKYGWTKERISQLKAACARRSGEIKITN